MALTKFLDPGRYLAFLQRRYALATYDFAAAQADEKRKFADLGLDMGAGLKRLNAILLPMSGKPFDHVTGTDSVHWLLFSCLSLTEWGCNVRDILEIGTFRGKTTVILKELFPAANIVTCDLPENDPILVNSYGRGSPEALAEYKATRDQRVRRSGVRFIEKNSFFLPSEAPGPYDLIWMDAGHLYPEVAWDMCNSWHLCKAGGRILCDDIYFHPHSNDSYASKVGHDVIEYLIARTGAHVCYFLKRENPEWSALAQKRKYVAVLRKPSGNDA